MKRIIYFAVIFCIFACLFAVAADAASTADAKLPIDVSRECSLTLKYSRSGASIGDFSVDLYLVADVSADCYYTLAEAFDQTHLSINGISSSDEWNAVRATLESFVAANKPEPTQSVTADENGNALFKGLAPGLYFAMPAAPVDNGMIYFFDSVIISLPDLDDSGEWVYDVTASPKASLLAWGSYESYKVVKLWRDSGDMQTRPAEITVDVMRNGETVKTVILSDQNNWSYAWYAANKGDIWQVCEKDIPDGYVMTVEKHSTAFSIINAEPDTPSPPPTGDTFDIGFYIALMCVSGLVLMLLSALPKRKGGENK